MKDFVQYLSSFQAVSDTAADAVLSISTPLTLKKGHLIHREGKVCRHIYLVVEGLGRVFYYQDGKDITNRFVLEQNVIAAMDSLYSKQPSYYSIELMEDCRLVAIRYDALEKLYTAFHDLEAVGRLLAIECYLEENERNRSFQIHSAKERYAQLVGRYPDLLQRVNLGHIASYVGVTQVQLSRIRAERVIF